MGSKMVWQRRTIALFALASAMLWLSLFAHAVRSVRDVVEIERVVTTAPVAVSRSCLLPRAYRDDPARPVPETVIGEAERRVLTTLERYYDVNSPVFALRAERLAGGVRARARSPERDIGCGIRSIERLVVHPMGNFTTVELLATQWSSFRTADGAVYTPENKVEYHFTFRKIDGRWKITSEEFTYPEGI